MKSRWFPSAAESIQSLHSSFEQNVDSQEELEAIRDNLRQLFNAVSNCVFVFQEDGQLRLMNRQAQNLIDSTTTEGRALLDRIFATRKRVTEGLPVQVELIGANDRPISLTVYSCAALNLEEGKALLFTALDLSQAMELSRKIQDGTLAERRRISRDLHDGLSQLLASLSLQAKALEIRHRHLGPEDAFARLSILASRCMQLGSEVYREFDEK